MGEVFHDAVPSIPAHAGSTWDFLRNWCSTTFNPRSRGAHRLCCSANGAVNLQSPLTRGALTTIRLSPACEPSIPAHAGSTLHIFIYADKHLGSLTSVTSMDKLATEMFDRNVAMLPAHKHPNAKFVLGWKYQQSCCGFGALHGFPNLLY